MRLKTSGFKNVASLYVIKDIKKESGASSTKFVEKLGIYAYLKERLNGEDPYVWAKKYIDDFI